MQQAAFFDLDKTVLSRSSTLALSRTMFKEGFIGRSALIKGAFAQVVYLLVGADHAKMEAMREAALELTRGWPRDRVLELVREVMDEVITPHVYAEALELIHDHQEAGRLVYLVSSSPEEIVLPLADALGVDRVLATQAEVDEAGLYTGKLAFYCYGHHKSDAIQIESELWDIDLSESWSYSDSVTDAWMLWKVGHPVAVNPDKELRRIADVLDWPVMSFRRPVSLRSRFAKATRPSPLRVGAAGAAAFGLMAWAVFRRKSDDVA